MIDANASDFKYSPAWTESPWASSSALDDADRSLGSAAAFESSNVTIPAVNIIETREDLRLEMVAPGMKKEAFKVTVDDSVLTISYDHEDNRQGDRRDWKYRMHEYNYHSFLRSFHLPDTVDTEGIEASYTDGILRLRIPKKKEAVSRRISVE